MLYQPHGELQAVGQIGAVAVAQCYTPAHHVVAQPFQGVSVHRWIMAHYGRQCRATMPTCFHLMPDKAETISSDSG